MSIPPYLTSGASSRAHHALIVALHGARSVQEADALAQREVRRIEQVFRSNPSTKKIVESLIILLDCFSNVLEPVDVDWALVPALQVAEGGKTIHQRRIGYLYLCERLPQGHELGLMLINTIRKDLTSTNPQDQLLGLNMTIHLPMEELRPAISQLLTSKSLLKHKSPSIRLKTLHAIRALYFPIEVGGKRGGSFPLELGRIVALLEKEVDTGVVCVLLDILRLMVVDNIHIIKDQQERLFLIQTTIVQAKRADAALTIRLSVLRLLKEMSTDDEVCLDPIIVWLASLLKETEVHGALLLEITSLISKVSALDTVLSGLILKRISKLLVPSRSGSLKHISNPNDHVLALRCLNTLPPSSWDSSLGQIEMRCIMEGVNSHDDTIRKQTLRLLHGLSPDLPSAVLSNHLKSLRDSTDLCLPLKIPDNLSIERKLKLGLEETAKRAVEVLTIQLEFLPLDEKGTTWVKGFAQICLAMSLDDDREVWEEGVGIFTTFVLDAPMELRVAYALNLLQLEACGDHTLSAVRAMTLAEYCPADGNNDLKAVEVILADIDAYPVSIQEISLVASVGISSRVSKDFFVIAKTHLDRALGKIKSGREGSYIRKRVGQIEILLSDDELLGQVKDVSKSRSAIKSLSKRSRTATMASPPASSRSITRSELRYDSYDPPMSTLTTRSSHSRADTARRFDRSLSSRLETSAGEYTLFNADEMDELDELDGLDNEEDSALLQGDSGDFAALRLEDGHSSPAQKGVLQRRVSDPFYNDNDDPSTPRLG